MQPKLLKYILFSPVLLLLLCSCDKQYCSTVSPIEPVLFFTLIDSTTQKSLIGPDRLYHPDTISELNYNISNYNTKDTVLTFYFGSIPSGYTTIFHLSRTEQDTLILIYELDQKRCFDIKRPIQLIYNNQSHIPGGYSFVIEK